MSKKVCKEENKIRKKEVGLYRFFCKKCGEEAVKEKHLCKPKKL